MESTARQTDTHATLGAGSLRVPAHSEREERAIEVLCERVSGDVRADDTHRVLYATDASIFELIPVCVVMPKSCGDLEAIVEVARDFDLPITPRSAGTSLSGQTVGPGIVVDTGRYMNRILSLDEEKMEVVVQPGVIRDDLNRYLKPYGLVFGPDTSTSNRCMIGGMIGNNSCGSNSIFYGTTRENLISLDAIFIDGTRREVGSYDRESWSALVEEDNILGKGARRLQELVAANAETIRDNYPKVEVRRRNTGYALDDLADSWLSGQGERDPSLARFFCGTEGTIALTAAARLKLHKLHSSEILVAVHFETLEASLEATVETVKFGPAAVELMDKRILDLARLNAEQERNSRFVQGNPGALLVIQFFGASADEVESKATELVEHLQKLDLGYAWPVIRGKDMKSVWELRKAGLGVLFGKPGDVKPETIVEDTAVAVTDLPAYIRGFARVIAKHNADCVYYAHASVGELHMRPELNLKDREDIQRAHDIAQDVADLVREFRGSLSGEHGDGRIRGPFVERALGSEVYALLREVKDTFDPKRLLNPGVIVDSPPMEQDWRYYPGYQMREWPSEFAYEESLGFQRAVERCNGSGVCRRPAAAGGTMCPSYMVTKEEVDSTRGRANLFRRLIQAGPDKLYSSEELRDALDLCLSCKGCKSDCPASVDMAKLKAEFQQGWWDRKGESRSAKMFAAVTELSELPQRLPGVMALTNWGQGLGVTKLALKKFLKIAPQRTLPAFAARGFHAQFSRRSASVLDPVGTVLLFVDEFTDRYEPEIGLAAVELLEAGGYRVLAPRLQSSGRTWLSKGFVREARDRMEANIRTIAPLLDDVDAVVGVEPSGVLTLVDEALDLPREETLRQQARAIADKTMLVQDFVARVAEEGRWRGEWKDEEKQILLHGHCHQKALVGIEQTVAALQLPPNYKVDVIPSGCCGMAGSFGYEADHYETSMQVGELVLFPAVRKADAAVTVAAPGTSCRHQIADGTGKRAIHPVEILRDAVLRRDLVAR